MTESPELFEFPNDLPKIFTVKELCKRLGTPDNAGLRVQLGRWRSTGKIDRIDKSLYRRRDT